MYQCLHLASDLKDIVTCIMAPALFHKKYYLK